MKKHANNQGITLIALVVTIIVLLILAGVSISMLTGQNGILNRATEAKEKTSKAQEEENTTLNNYEKVIDKYTSNLPSTEYTMPYLPDGTKFEKLEGTDLNTGLVIKEKVTGSEYVWVEVPKTNEVYLTAGINITSFTNEEYTKIEEDLHTYTKDYRNGTSYNDVYSSDTTTGWFINSSAYDTAKKKMLKSVYENGGFWVGRYEAGIEKNRTEKGAATVTPLSKENLYPYTYVTRTQAKVLAEQVESGSYASSLMFGIQWDLILAFMHNKGKIDNTLFVTDSTQIGNYCNNIWNKIDGEFKYSIDDGNNFLTGPYEKKDVRGVLLTTGANKNFSTMNIYDLCGNVWEWTLENSLNEDTPCVCFGGAYGTGGNLKQANSRNGSGTIEFVHCSIGFRFSIF